jgi:peptidoglycan/LPS O-acetylase OafA/YrhL
VVHFSTDSPARTLRAIRLVLVGALVIGTLGTAAELLLLGHYDDATQLIPLALLGLLALTLVWHALDRSARPLRALQLLVLACLVSGALGVYYHYEGNVEFELEMYPDTSGLALVRKAMMGATPALAPGTMAELGLIGLAYTLGHPRLRRRVQTPEGDGGRQ